MCPYMRAEEHGTIYKHRKATIRFWRAEYKKASLGELKAQRVALGKLKGLRLFLAEHIYRNNIAFHIVFPYNVPL